MCYNIAAMKFIDNLKNKIGMNMIAICGWVYIYLFADTIINNAEYQNGEAFGLVLIFNIIECIIFISFMIWLIELVVNHKLKNEFINTNIIFCIFWLIGILASLILNIIFIFGLIYNFVF